MSIKLCGTVTVTVGLLMAFQKFIKIENKLIVTHVLFEQLVHFVCYYRSLALDEKVCVCVCTSTRVCVCYYRSAALEEQIDGLLYSLVSLPGLEQIVLHVNCLTVNWASGILFLCSHCPSVKEVQ